MEKVLAEFNKRLSKNFENHPDKNKIIGITNGCLVQAINEFQNNNIKGVKLPKSNKRENIDYILEASKDGKNWKYMAGFIKGQRSRFNDAPFDENIVLEEAKSFKVYRGKDYPFVRVIIEV